MAKSLLSNLDSGEPFSISEILKHPVGKRFEYISLLPKYIGHFFISSLCSPCTWRCNSYILFLSSSVLVKNRITYYRNIDYVISSFRTNYNVFKAFSIFICTPGNVSKAFELISALIMLSEYWITVINNNHYKKGKYAWVSFWWGRIRYLFSS